MPLPRSRVINELVIPILQIAGFRNASEAIAACDAGATHLGFPMGPGVVAEDCPPAELDTILSVLPRGVVPVIITYLRDALSVRALCDPLGVTHVQLHGDIDAAECDKLRRAGFFVMKSLIVGKRESTALLETLAELEPTVDAFLTDTYDARTGNSGATGKPHDWSISREIVARAKKPVVLAGGLTPLNVARAIEVTGAAGVDSHTGVEDETGAKDPGKMRAFVAAAREALGRASTGEAK